MSIDSLIFCPPRSFYDSQHDKLIWIPRECHPQVTRVHRTFKSEEEKDKELFRPNESLSSEFIPCLLYEPFRPVDKIIIFFHANAEDASFNMELLQMLTFEFCAYVLAVEYPKYGVYSVPESTKNSQEIIKKDAEAIFNFLTLEKGFEHSRIVITGRSIGSGPACFLAGKFEFGGLVILSGFSSLLNVIKGFRIGGVLTPFIDERFDNLAELSKNKTPSLFIHGQKDEMVSFSHAEVLKNACKGPAESVIREKMTHNFFKKFEDVINPMKCFLKKHKKDFLESSKKKITFNRKLHLEFVSSSRSKRFLMKTTTILEKVPANKGDETPKNQTEDEVNGIHEDNLSDLSSWSLP